MILEIPANLKNRLLSELEYIIRKIEVAENSKKKTYWLSAAHGAVERTMRFHKDNELIIVHAILNLHFTAVQGLLGRLAAGDDVIPLQENFWEQIVLNLTDLKILIAENRTTYPVLERIQGFAYSLTGPGYYTISYLDSMTEDET